MENLKWYFRQGFWSILTIPVFVVLASLFVISLGNLHKNLHLFGRYMDRLWIVGIIAILFFFYIVALFILGPPVLYVWLMHTLPEIWSDLGKTVPRRIKATVLATVLVMFAAWVMHVGSVWAIGWVADHNPCAAYKAGVTGSIPPENC